MAKPRIVLEIKNNIPQIIYTSADNQRKSLTSDSYDLEVIFKNISADLEFIDSNLDFRSLLNLAYAEGDESSIDVPPFELSNATGNFELESELNTLFKKLDRTKKNFSSLEGASDEVKNELKRNQNIDILAALIYRMYEILIFKTLAHATDLGLDQIELNDESHDLRLAEIMTKELANFDIELKISS